MNGDCCTWEVMSKKPDFQGQHGWLREEVEATGKRVIFYSKFHYELNSIERYFSLFPLYIFPRPDWTFGRFWCAAKYFARENCKYNLKSLRETVLKALGLVTLSAIFQHFMRTIDVYRPILEHGLSSLRKRSIAVIGKSQNGMGDRADLRRCKMFGARCILHVNYR